MKTLLTLLLFIPTFLFAQGIIITEISQGESGNKEYVELLVIGDQKCSVVDIRSWIVDDNNGDFGPNGISRGYLKFTDDSLWSRILSGTKILLWNVEDTSLVIRQKGLDIIDADPNDFRIIIPAGCKNVGTAQQTCPTSQYIVGVTNIPTTTNPSYNNPFVLIATTFRWNNLIPFGNTSDGAQTRKPDGSFFMGLAYGANTLHPLIGIYGQNALRFSTANTYYLTNQQDFDYNDKNNWSTGIIRNPAEPNSLENQQYIQSVKVDDDCTLDIKPLVDLPNNSDDSINLPIKTVFYNLLGQIVEPVKNKVLIQEDHYENQNVVRKKVVFL